MHQYNFNSLGNSMYHVSANVSQYVIRHDTRSTCSGSHMPLEPTSAFLALLARSMGTSKMIEAGRPKAKKMGTSR